MATQHTTTTVTPIAHRRSVVDTTDVEMLEANHGNIRGVHFERSYECHKCQRIYRASQVMVVDGVPYCIPHRHYIDALHENAKEGN